MEAGHCHPPQQRPGPTGTARCLPSPAPVSGQRPPGPTATANPSPVPSLRASPNPAAAAALTAPGCARRAPPRPPGPGSSARSAPGSGRAPLGRWLPAGGGSVGRLRARPGWASAPAPGQRGGCCGREAGRLRAPPQAAAFAQRAPQCAAGVCGYSPAAKWLSLSQPQH